MIQIPSTDVGKEALKNHDSYYAWLCKQSGISGPLARLFFETDFRWKSDIPDDENRAKVALDLREQYAEHLLVGDNEFISDDVRKKIDRVVKSILGPSCVFEVLVSLAKEIDETLNMEEESHVADYFGKLMDNVGFDFYDEEDYDDKPEMVTDYWAKRMNRWLDRDYLPDGEGGLFPLEMDSEGLGMGNDQRKRSLWDQMQDWLSAEI